MGFPSYSIFCQTEQLALWLFNLICWYLPPLAQAPSSTLNTHPLLPSFILINSYPFFFFFRQRISLFGLPSQSTTHWVGWITEIYFSCFWRIEVQDQGVSIPSKGYVEESAPSPYLGLLLFSGNLCWPLAGRTQIFTFIFTWYFVCMSVSRFPFV